MTSFVTEHQTDAAATGGVFHVNETGYFARGTGPFRHASGRFNLQGPFSPGVKLPAEIEPGPNDGWFWIGWGTDALVRPVGRIARLSFGNLNALLA